jgi:hypothetical protein
MAIVARRGAEQLVEILPSAVAAGARPALGMVPYVGMVLGFRIGHETWLYHSL